MHLSCSSRSMMKSNIFRTVKYPISVGVFSTVSMYDERRHRSHRQSGYYTAKVDTTSNKTLLKDCQEKMDVKKLRLTRRIKQLGWICAWHHLYSFLSMCILLGRVSMRVSSLSFFAHASAASFLDGPEPPFTARSISSKCQPPVCMRY